MVSKLHLTPWTLFIFLLSMLCISQASSKMLLVETEDGDASSKRFLVETDSGEYSGEEEDDDGDDVGKSSVKDSKRSSMFRAGPVGGNRQALNWAWNTWGAVQPVTNPPNTCLMPGSSGVYTWPGPGQPCTGTPCDICTCVAGNPPRMEVDKDGCKKPKKCQEPCQGSAQPSTQDHQVGDNWQCWIDDWNCMGTCTCTDTGAGPSTSWGTSGDLSCNLAGNGQAKKCGGNGK